MFWYYLINSIVSLTLTFVYMLTWKKRYNIYFTLLQVITPMVCIAAFTRAVSTTLEGAVIANNIIYLAGCYFLPFLLVGLCSLCDIVLPVKGVLGILTAESLVYISVITNDYTHFFYKSLALGENNGVTVLVKEYGFMHTVAYVMMALCIVATLVCLIYSMRKKRKAAVPLLLLVTVLFFVCTGMFFLSDLILGEGQEEVLIYTIMQAVVLYISRSSSYYYIDSYIMDNMQHGSGIGCIAFDKTRRLLVCNKRAEDWFPELTELHVGYLVANARGINPRFSEWFDRWDDHREDYTEIVKSGELSIKMEVSFRNIDGKECYCFILSDDTAQQELLRVLNNNIERVTGAVSKYVDPSLLSNMLDEENLAADGEEFTIAVMFADLRGFTALSEDTAPRDTIKILNKYLSIAERAIHKYSGTLDKYIGDAVMAFWVDVKGNGEAALNAARAALEIKNTIISVEDEVFKDLDKEVFYGIGLNYGKAIVGNIGSENRKDYTVIGDTVNVASRLEGHAPKNTIYITAEFMNVLGRRISVRQAENNLRVKGKAAPLMVYELLGLGDNRQALADPLPEEETKRSRPLLYICGSRGSYPVSGVRFSKFGGETTCFIIKYNRHAIVIDCGTGFLNAQAILRGCTTVDVVLTHMHYDHCIGLLNWSVFPKDVTPTFYGNFGRWFGEDTLHELFRPPFWPVDLSRGVLKEAPSDDTPIELSDGITMRFFDAPHPNFAKLVIIDVAGKRLCIMGDCESYDGIPLRYLKGADYLIYDGMYDDPEYSDHIGWGHSSWQEGVRLASRAGVGHLLISHHDAKSSDAVLLDREERARLMFPASTFARTGDRFEI